MTRLITRRTALITAAAASATLAAPRLSLAAGHTVHEVQMLNKHPEDSKLRQIFFPRIQVVAAGDGVNFVSTDKGHNSASIKDMIPDGEEAWKGKINADIEVTFATPGFYGYQCTPHASVGMVGLVIVTGEGMMDNLEAVKGIRHRGKSKGVWEDIWAEVDGMDLTAA